MLDQLRGGAERPAGGVRYATSLSTGHLAIIDSELLDDIVARFEKFRTR